MDEVGHCDECVHFDGWKPVRNSISMTRVMAVFAGAVREPPLRVVDADGIGYVVSVFHRIELSPNPVRCTRRPRHPT